MIIGACVGAVFGMALMTISRALDWVTLTSGWGLIIPMVVGILWGFLSGTKKSWSDSEKE